MATDTGFGMVRFFEDFLVDTINVDAWTVANADSATDFAVNVQMNGVIRGGVADDSENDLAVIYGELLWQADDAGPLVIEVRMKPVTSLSCRYYVGWSDQKATERPMDYNAGALATAAADAAGLYYAGGESNATWRCGGVKNGSASTQTAVSSSLDPVVGTFQTFRVVLDSNGNGSFYVDGNIIVENVPNCVTPGTSLLPYVYVADDGAAGSLDIDYVYMSKGRI